MEMVTIRFFSFVLVLISSQASHLVAEIHQVMEIPTATKGEELEVTRNILIDVNKINFDEVPARIGVETKRFGGRKMKMEGVLNKDDLMEVEEAPRVEASKISGRDAYASKKYNGNQRHNPKYQTRGHSHKAPSAEPFRYKLHASNVRRLGTTLSSDEKVPEKQLDNAYQNLESQKLLAAANEIANLMNKDYTGDGMGHHKPPINNANPFSMEHNQP